MSHKEERMQTDIHLGEGQEGEAEEVQATQLNCLSQECYRLNALASCF